MAETTWSTPTPMSSAARKIRVNRTHAGAERGPNSAPLAIETKVTREGCTATAAKQRYERLEACTRRSSCRRARSAPLPVRPDPHRWRDETGGHAAARPRLSARWTVRAAAHRDPAAEHQRSL